MKGYAEYKESGVPWLVQLPAHWNIVRAKQIFKSIDERSKTGNEELLSVSSSNGVVKRDETNVTMFKAESYVGYKLCWPEDLVINSLWAWQYGLGFSNVHGIISTAYSVFRIKDNSLYNYKFYNYFVRSTNFHWELRARSKGIWKSRYQMSDDDFLASPIIVPPRKEQDEIVRFLDNKLAKIDRLISIKQKQIELLKDKRQALIHTAVTKGIDSNTLMKNSGINWIGEIPAQWEICKIRDISISISTGSTPASEKGNVFTDSVNGYTWFTPGDFSDDIYLTKSERHLSEIGKSLVHTFPQNSVLMVGIGATIGKIAIYNNTFSCNQQINIIVCNKSNDKKFVAYSLIALKNGILQNINSATLPILNQAMTKNLPMIKVPLKVQHEIVDYIEKKEKKIFYCINKINNMVSLLQEFRTRLISDAVTGAIDVSDWKSKATNKD